MEVFWGLIIIALGLLAWVGQAIAWIAPATAVRLSLADAESSVDATFWADGRGEAAWDTFSLWTLPLAGVLLIGGHEAWAWLGLLGGGMYVYFGGRGIVTRLEMQRGGIRIGDPGSVRVGMTALAIWLIAGLITAVAAMASLA